MPKQYKYQEVLTVRYKTDYLTYFEVDGDLTRVLEVSGSKDYVKDWIRGKLRKMENGQIKVVVKCPSERKRDWGQEEKIRKQMWTDVNVNEIPLGIDFDEIICTKPMQTVSSVEYERPPSPTCKIS